MTFGVVIRTAGGHLQIHGDYMVPQFIGKVTTSQFGSDISEGAESGYVTRNYVGVAPDSGGRAVMVFWTLPDGVWWYSKSTYLDSTSSGVNLGAVAFLPSGTVVSGTPTAYVFALDFVANSGVNPAMRIYGPPPALKLNFDSGQLHLNLDQAPGGFSFVEGSAASTSLSLPNKSAFLIPDVVRIAESHARLAEFSTHIEWFGCLKKVGSTLYSQMIKGYHSSAFPGSGGGISYNEDNLYGNTSGLVVPIINAAIYD